MQDVERFKRMNSGKIIDEGTAINQEAWNNLCGIFGEDGMKDILENFEPET